MPWQETSRRQGGVISRRQLLATGSSRHDVDHLVRSGRLERDPRWSGVLRAPGADVTEKGECWAAVLGCRGTVSYQTAATVWEVPVEDEPWLHVTVPDRRRVRRRRGIKVHRVKLLPSSVTEVDGLRVTTRRETIFDCLGVLRPAAALSLADRALQQRWITIDDLEHRLLSQPGRWGNLQLRALLELLDPAAEAESERRFHALLRDAGISGWQAQFEVVLPSRRARLDVAFPVERIAVEIDGRAAHAHQEAFVDDRQRQNELVRAGWIVLRYTRDDIVHRPYAIIAEMQELLAQQRGIAR